MKKPWRFWNRSGVYYVQYRSNPGKWITTNTRDPDEAERFALANCPEIETPMEMLFGDFARDFFVPGKCKWILRQEARGRTLRLPYLLKVRGLLDNYLLPKFKDTPLTGITRRMVDDWLLDLKSVRNRQPLMADIKNKIIGTLRHLMADAVDRGLIEQDPTKGIPPYRDRVTATRGIFTPEELQKLFPEAMEALLDVWLTLDWALYFYLQASAGLRPGEAAALQWRDWIRPRRGLVVSASIEKLTRERKSTKTSIIKPVPLTARAGELLATLEAQRTDQPDSLIFRAKDDGPMLPETGIKHFKASVVRAGLELNDRTPYSLRHSFDTHALRVLEHTTVQKLMGHKTLSMTMDTYYHPTDDARLAALPPEAWEGIERLW